MSGFKELNASDFNENIFNTIGKEWMLITAKKDDKINTMTAGWGGMGVMWGKPVVFIAIRPQRYTKEFIDTADDFSICFFDDFKKEFGYFGSISGRDEDKINKIGLNVLCSDDVPYFKESRVAVCCRKIFEQTINPNGFIDISLPLQWYATEDYHTIYFGEITKILVKE